jgi:hypothetical protein
VYVSNRYDWRLSFVNLKNDKTGNSLSGTERELIWLPKLVFENNPEGKFIKNEDLSVLTVRKEGNPENHFDFIKNEFEKFDGNKNPVIYENKYDMKLTCNLELHYYPFDDQHCFIEVLMKLDIFDKPDQNSRITIKTFIHIS